MIAPLRAAHRRVFLAMSFLVPAVLGAAVMLRHPEPSEARPEFRPEGRLVARDVPLFTKYSVSASQWEHEGKTYLVLSPDMIPEPDVLVYAGDASPPRLEDAHLLGRFVAGGGLELPASTQRRQMLLLYSPARGKVLDQGVIELLP